MEIWFRWNGPVDYVVGGLNLVLAIWATVHAVGYKRDPRAATLWLGVVWLLPPYGAVLYFLLGVNRIRRWAESLRGGMERFRSTTAGGPSVVSDAMGLLPPTAGHLARLARAIDVVVGQPLLRGNRVDALVNGEVAFPAMGEAIVAARRSVSLCSYIFDDDSVGREFVEVLADAVRRGVEVRVLIDATGARYSWPRITRRLKARGVPHALFLRLFPIRRLLAMNLRNHRKLLVVDGRVGFTGGMNLREGHRLDRPTARPVQDVHFRFEGPVVAQFQEAFAEDWQFTTGEALRGEAWFPELPEVGSALARGIADGPDEDFDKLRWILLTALASARQHIRVVTPYFIPEPAIVAALNVAVLRGVTVDILLPSKSNLPVVHQASRSYWWQLLEFGCRLWLTPPPFDHGKLVVVDDAWSFVGSANWDPRSLRLNFEFNVECYDAELAATLGRVIEAKRSAARRVTLAEVDGRSLPVRLGDGLARLLSPFL